MRVCDHENEAEELRGQVAALQYERRKDAVVLRMAPRLQSSAEKLRQHLLGRSRGRGGGGGLRGREHAGQKELTLLDCHVMPGISLLSFGPRPTDGAAQEE